MVDATPGLTDARELAILSACCADGSLVDRLAWLSPNAFRGERTAAVWGTMLLMRREGLPIDPLGIADMIQRSGGDLREHLGEDWQHFLFSLVDQKVTCDPEGHARQIQDAHQRRRLQQTLEAAVVQLGDPSADPAAIVARIEAAATGPTERPRIMPVDQFITSYPEMRPAVVEGVLRRGETMNVIAAAKLGKSWFGYGLALSVATGRPWLGRFPTQQGKALVIDNELHRETLSARMQTVMSAMGIYPEQCGPWFSLLALRGESVDVNSLGTILQGIKPGEYALIVVDAFYRILPDGTSENDNAQMTAVYNAIDKYGARLESAFVLIHHSSKGDQSGKSITDVGSGAGSISRAADSHVILRPHEEADSVVMQAALRSWAPLQPVGLRWYYPTWTTDDNLDPTKIQGRRIPVNSEEAKQNRLDEKAEKALAYIRKLGQTGGTKSKIRDGAGISSGLGQVLDQLVEDKLIEPCEVHIPSNNKTCDGWRSVGPWPVSAAQDASHSVTESLLNGVI